MTSQLGFCIAFLLVPNLYSSEARVGDINFSGIDLLESRYACNLIYFQEKQENYHSPSIGIRDGADLSDAQVVINTWIEESAREAREPQRVLFMLRKMIF